MLVTAVDFVMKHVILAALKIMILIE